MRDDDRQQLIRRIWRQKPDVPRAELADLVRRGRRIPEIRTFIDEVEELDRKIDEVMNGAEGVRAGDMSADERSRIRRDRSYQGQAGPPPRPSEMTRAAVCDAAPSCPEGQIQKKKRSGFVTRQSERCKRAKVRGCCCTRHIGTGEKPSLPAAVLAFKPPPGAVACASDATNFARLARPP